MKTNIIVRPTAFPLGIRVQIQQEGAEGIPVDQGRNFAQGVPTFSDTGILVLDCIIEERAH